MSTVKNTLSKFASILAGRDRPGPGRNTLVARAAVLFVTLVIIKLSLLFGFREHLYQTHWRTGELPSYRFSIINFYVFVGLLAATFLELGRQSPLYSNRDIRWLNLWFVLAGTLFVFFSFHAINSNYIEPVQDGTLKLMDLRWYLNNNLFFAKPRLAAYFIAYPLIYYCLVSARREGWSFYFLSAIVSFYLLTNLRELVLLGWGLFAVNCFGVGALFSLRRSGTFLTWTPFLLLVSLVLAAWLLFAGQEIALSHPSFSMVIIMLTGLFGWISIRVLTRHSTIFPVLSHFLLFYLVAFCLLSVHNFRLAANYLQFLIFALAVPHYFWHQFTFVLVLLVGSIFINRRWPRVAHWGFDFFAFFLIAGATLDRFVSRTLGSRLDWNVLTMSDDPVLLWRTIRPFAERCVLVIVVLVLLYYFGVWFVARFRVAKGRNPTPFRFSRADKMHLGITFVLIASFCPLLLDSDKAEPSWLINLARSVPFLQGRQSERFEPAELVRMARELQLPGVPPSTPTTTAGPARKLNVFLIVTESSYNRYLSLFGAPDETQPLLKKYRDRMELFPNFYSVFPNSFHGRFATFNGLYPTEEYVSYQNPHIPCPTLFEILHDQGYHVSFYYSCFGEYTRQNDYLQGRKIDAFYDADNMPGEGKYPKVSWGLDEEATLAAVQKQFKQYADSGQRFFLTYVPVAPHMPFDTKAPQFQKFPEAPSNLTHHYLGRYKNQLLYMDWIISSMLDTLDRLHLLDDTLVIITNDHGEMLGDEDDGLLGHGWNLKPSLGNNPLIILNPQVPGYRINNALGSQVDILPTMLDLLNIPLPRGELYQGNSLYDERAASNKVVYLTSYRDRALVTDHQYILSTGDAAQGQTTIFAISNYNARTIYEPTSETNRLNARLDEFVKFQNSFIANYGYYKHALGGAGSPVINSVR